jgi:hypothetical protein
MRAKLIRRLQPYWKIEAANAVIVPVSAIILVLNFGGRISPALLAAIVPCGFLLIVGALAWRMEAAQLTGNDAPARYWTPRLAFAKPLSAVLIVIAAGVFAFGWSAAPEAGWTADRIAAASLLALAVLEYVNYFHVQLQHFDNVADFKRLLAGRGFRKAHLARAIEAWRNAP